MAPQTTHSRARMQQAANKIQESAGDIKSIQNQLRGHQGQLTGHWQGQGANAFMRVYQQFDAEFNQVLKDLDIIHQKLVDTRIKYDATEQQTTGNMGRLGGIINA